ncbi:MAG: hypothetical protein UH229_07705, partial [Lachnospiraceae bacterium]|nr:hypothetical protein [Lachnospiraceae bacterium]
CYNEPSKKDRQRRSWKKKPAKRERKTEKEHGKGASAPSFARSSPLSSSSLEYPSSGAPF